MRQAQLFFFPTVSTNLAKFLVPRVYIVPGWRLLPLEEEGEKNATVAVPRGGFGVGPLVPSDAVSKLIFLEGLPLLHSASAGISFLCSLCVPHVTSEPR